MEKVRRLKVECNTKDNEQGVCEHSADLPFSKINE